MKNPCYWNYSYIPMISSYINAIFFKMVIAPPTSLGIKVNINTYDSWLWLLLITHPTIPYNSHLVGGGPFFIFPYIGHNTPN